MTAPQDAPAGPVVGPGDFDLRDFRDGHRPYDVADRTLCAMDDEEWPCPTWRASMEIERLRALLDAARAEAQDQVAPEVKDHEDRLARAVVMSTEPVGADRPSWIGGYCTALIDLRKALLARGGAS